MNATYQLPGPCACESGRCAAFGTKLNKLGHIARYCTCFQCQGTRSQRKGRASEARAWKQLGGVGMTRDDNSPHRWDISVEIENKSGAQIPAHFITFVGSKWTKDALFQASKKTPIGEDSFPAIRLELAPSRAYLLVDISPRKL